MSQPLRCFNVLGMKGLPSSWCVVLELAVASRLLGMGELQPLRCFVPERVVAQQQADR